MGNKTSQERIAEIEAIPLIYGSLSSGASERYIVKANYPKLLTITEGGYAKDIFLKKDVKKERIKIEDNPEGNAYDSFQDDMMEGANSFLGILDSKNGSGLAASLEKLGNDNKAVFWCNGIWSIIEKQMANEQDLMIPIELASRIIGRTNKSKSEVLSSLTPVKYENEKFERVSSLKLAELLSMSDLYSIWKYDDIITCMLNTDMFKGPYKLKRIYKNININVSVKLIHEEARLGRDEKIKLTDNAFESKKDYENTMKHSFEQWGGDYNEEYAKFGDNPIILHINISEQCYEKSAVIRMINYKSADDTGVHISNVDCGDNWKINNLGKMTLYNHLQYEKISSTKYKQIIKHEFGHFMGLGDAYNGALASEEVSTEDIMWEGDEVSPNDIEMLLMAVLKNKKQYFYSNGTKIKSEAITE